MMAFDSALMLVALVLGLGVLGLIGFVAFIAWLLETRDKPLRRGTQAWPPPGGGKR